MCASLEMEGVIGNLDGGYLRVFAGPAPASASAPLVEANTMLLELRLSDPASDVSADTVTALPASIAPVAAAGEPRFYRAYRADGLTAEWQGPVGFDGCGLVFNFPS
jgi:hypothetical protein